MSKVFILLRFALDKLKRTHELAQKGASRYSIITINNWDKWQAEGQTVGHTMGTQWATTKERKENIYINNRDKNFFHP